MTRATDSGSPPLSSTDDCLTDSASAKSRSTGTPDPVTRRQLPLTVLAHPELERIGDRVLLTELAGGRPARLARTNPRFAAPSGGPARTLEDRSVSRDHIDPVWRTWACKRRARQSPI